MLGLSGALKLLAPPRALEAMPFSAAVRLGAWLLLSARLAALADSDTFDQWQIDADPRALHVPLNGTAFPLNLTRSGHPMSVRREAGDDSALRRAIARAIEDPTYVLTILVLGGSEPQGGDCGDPMEGAVEAGVFAWWTRHGATGVATCPWPARITRYLARLLPKLNFRVISGAQGGCGSGCALSKVNAELGTRLINEPAGAKWSTLARPLGHDVDLAILDFNANDSQDYGGSDVEQRNCTAAPFEALVHFLLASGRFAKVPTVALLDAPIPSSSRGCSYDEMRALHRKISQLYDLPLVDPLITGGRDHGSDIIPGLDPQVVASLRRALGTRGFGHAKAPYHEWIAAVLAFGLIAPAAPALALGVHQAPPPRPRPLPAHLVLSSCDSSSSSERSVALCHLADGTNALFDYTRDDCCAGAGRWRDRAVAADAYAECGQNVRQDGPISRKQMCGWGHMDLYPAGSLNPLAAKWTTWKWGYDAPGKYGFITCNSRAADAATLRADIICERGDLLVGYLESYDQRMGAVRGLGGEGDISRRRGALQPSPPRARPLQKGERDNHKKRRASPCSDGADRRVHAHQARVGVPDEDAGHRRWKF